MTLRFFVKKEDANNVLDAIVGSRVIKSRTIPLPRKEHVELKDTEFYAAMSWDHFVIRFSNKEERIEALRRFLDGEKGVFVK